MKMKRIWVAIVCDGNGGWHIYEKLCNENVPCDVDLFAQRCMAIAQDCGGSLVTMYRKADVVERIRF